MSREEKMLLFANSYSDKLKSVTANPPVDKRYSSKSRDKIAVSMRSYYRQVSALLAPEVGKAN